jgi:hypothetical protein
VTQSGVRHRALALLVAIALATTWLSAVTRQATAAIPAAAAHWPLDEMQGTTAFDAIGDLDGFLAGGATRFGPGFAGRAISFDGLDDRLVVPDDPLFRADAMSISLWVRADPVDPPATGAVILEKGDLSCQGGAYGLLVDGDGVKLRVRETWSHAYTERRYQEGLLEKVGNLWDGEWHHLALSISSGEWGTMTVVKDGRIVTGIVDDVGADHAAMTTTDLAIGGPAADCPRPAFEGDVDDVRVFDRYVGRADLGELEPEILPTIEMAPVPPLTVGQPATLGFTIDPPPFEGRVELHFVDNAGNAHLLQRRDWAYNFDDDQQLQAIPEVGGSGTLRVRYLGSAPWLPASASIAATIGRATTHTYLGFSTAYVAGETARVGVTISPQANVKPTGTIALYERKNGALIQLASGPVVSPEGSFYGGREFFLPARAAGTYALEARYSGDVSHLPSTGTGDLVVAPSLSAGPVLINGGAAVTTSHIVTISMPAVGATAVQLKPDSGTYVPPEPYVPSKDTWLVAPWYGNNTDGRHTMHVRWADALGRWSSWQSDSIIVDRTAPTTTAVRHAFTTTGILSGAAPVRILWTGEDNASGVARYVVREQVDGGPWTTVSSTVTASGITRYLQPGRSYRYAVRAVDNAGHVGAYAYGVSFKVTAYQQTSGSIKYTGTWSPSSSIAYWGGTAKFATAQGAKASFVFTGRSVAWVGIKSYNRGKANVYVNGVFSGSVDLYAAATQGQRVVWSKSWSTSATRTIEIRVVGTVGRPRVDIDGFFTGT